MCVKFDVFDLSFVGQHGGMKVNVGGHFHYVWLAGL